MKYLALSLILALLAVPPMAKAEDPKGAEGSLVDWRLLARSQIVVGGVPTAIAPGDAATKGIESEYRAWKLEKPIYIKGTQGARPLTILLPKSGPEPKEQRSYFFFLTEFPGNPELGYVPTEGAIGSSVRQFSYDLLSAILSARYNNTYAQFWWRGNVAPIARYGPEDDDFTTKLENMLTAISAAPASPERQKALVRQLNADFRDVGFIVVTYLIARMENWQPFPAETLTIEVTDSDGMTRDVTVKPELMVDAIDALLPQIGDTKSLLKVESRFLSDSPSDDARENAIRAWRIHDGRFSLRVTLFD
ncbi:hypothetical protein [Pelagibius sp.]|uniref:hypothetical protein n=1 Tax=Pelagibius sp. TaxID=1931238 RepID=UPI0026151017|nr:hypothetical protein [Pelagibius sp.]